MSDSEAEDPQLVEEGKLRINIKFQNEEAPMQFVVKPLTQFSKMFNTYTQKRGVQKGTYRYTYDGLSVLPLVGGVENTPKMMGWEKGKTYNLDAFTEQSGGG